VFGIGLAAGGWAKNEAQAAPLANLIAFPMMFLSGVFFPRFLMPDWLATITQFLPLTPFIDGLRLIITEGMTILQVGTEVAMLAAWAVIIYLVAFKLFRWE
jgi:ABC-2 type transport system permease protein